VIDKAAEPLAQYKPPRASPLSRPVQQDVKLREQGLADRGRGRHQFLRELVGFSEIGGAPIVQAVLDGQDTAILLAAERAPVAGVYLVARHDVTELAHLRGGCIGVLSETGPLAISARAMLRECGITATLEPLGALPKIYAALRALDIDAGMLTDAYRLAAQRALGLTAFPIPATGLPSALATTRRLIHRRRGLVAREIVGS
jgi:hypothetical protein